MANTFSFCQEEWMNNNKEVAGTWHTACQENVESFLAKTFLPVGFWECFLNDVSLTTAGWILIFETDLGIYKDRPIQSRGQSDWISAELLLDLLDWPRLYNISIVDQGFHAKDGLAIKCGTRGLKSGPLKNLTVLWHPENIKTNETLWSYVLYRHTGRYKINTRQKYRSAP